MKLMADFVGSGLSNEKRNFSILDYLSHPMIRPNPEMKKERRDLL